MAEDPTAPGPFERDTQVRRLDSGSGERALFGAVVADGWRAGRGPHGGYLAAILLRALRETVDDPARAVRSMTIHFARAPEPGEVEIETVVEREGRSLSTLSARMRQDGRLIALVLSAFSVPWEGALEVSELPMPDVAPATPDRTPGGAFEGAPPFRRHIVMQPRFGGRPFAGAGHAMELGGWIGLVEERPLDDLALAFFTDALLPAPFMCLTEPNVAPTIDLTIHFREPMPRVADPDPHELCLAHVRGGVIHQGFFEEDTIIWASDGTVLAQSRQLALLMPSAIG